jgi:hypothetical protein
MRQNLFSLLEQQGMIPFYSQYVVFAAHTAGWPSIAKGQVNGAL